MLPSIEVNGNIMKPPVRVIPKTETNFTAAILEINHVDENNVSIIKKYLNCAGLINDNIFDALEFELIMIFLMLLLVTIIIFYYAEMLTLQLP